MSRKKWRAVLIVGLLSALTAAYMAAGAAARPSGSGPTIVVGSKNFTEEYILGELYSQALAAKGFNVSQKQNIGATEVIDTALTSGKISMYPEYVGEIDQTVFHITKLPSTAHGWWQLAVTKNKARNITVLNATPFFDVDAIAVLKATASKYGLKTVADLKKVPGLSICGFPEFRTRYAGLVGLNKAYGLTKVKFVQIGSISVETLLDNHNATAGDIFSTEPALATGKYTPLTDTKHIFGFQNVAPVISKKTLAAGGMDLEHAINAVTAKLTIPAMIAMNKAVAVDKKTPAAVAKSFLKANGLL